MSHGKNNQDQMPDAGDESCGSKQPLNERGPRGSGRDESAGAEDRDYAPGTRPPGGHSPAGAGGEE